MSRLSIAQRIWDNATEPDCPDLECAAIDATGEHRWEFHKVQRTGIRSNYLVDIYKCPDCGSWKSENRRPLQ